MAFDLIPLGMGAFFIALIFNLRLTRRAFSELTDEEKLQLVDENNNKSEWGLILALPFFLLWIFVPTFFLREYAEWLLFGECALLVLTMFIYQAVAYRRLARVGISEAYRRAFFKGSWILVAGSLVQAATLVLATRVDSP